ncbi:MAG: prepilin-type N-terminal cleavage/methylation domain-containing protein [Patescibacteria group bacterium]|jgi:prepilin-type N-terminal cleavage/methylation domain-containing protein
MTISRTQTNEQGFTLIELLIVIAIIGLLATLAIVSLTTAQRKARDTKRLADVKQLQNAVELFYSESSAYPLSTDTTNETWTEFGSTTGIGNYITNIPVDPTNSGTSIYTYGANSVGTEYFIGAKLEDTSHTALSGDDDGSYIVGTTAGWLAGVDYVSSNDTGATDLNTFSCADPIYCASE